MASNKDDKGPHLSSDLFYCLSRPEICLHIHYGNWGTYNTTFVMYIANKGRGAYFGY
jgi:hypothetical protein